MNPSVLPIRKIYLAGPITGLNYGQAALGWRAELAQMLPPNITVYSPMRGKEFLKDQVTINGSPEAYKGTVLASPKGILMRDEYDVRTADLVVFNFLGADRVSVGSVYELGFARALNKPTILVMERDGSNPHHHVFVTDTSGYWVDSLPEAAASIKLLLNPGI